jgi:HTH-type transcriptional regulator/antitoxin HigA
MPAVLDFTKPHILRNEREYEAAVVRVDELLRLDVEDGSDEAEELLFLAVLIEEYEHREYPIDVATPRDLVDFALDQRDLTRADLAEIMGGRSRVSDFFKGKPALSKNQARAHSEWLGIPLGALLAE